MCFPTLFPSGAGDCLGQRQVQVTTGKYIKHLMQYDDGCLARHPPFHFFTLNTEMRHRAFQTGRVYTQHPGDGQLSLDELRDMVGRQREAFSSRVLHYASSLRGTKQYWQGQQSRLLSMVDTLGLPFTHSTADLQWPELAQLICTENHDSRTARAKAVIEKPALQTGSSITELWSLLRPSTLECLEPLTTGYGSSGSIVGVHMCLAWPGTRCGEAS